MAQLVRMDARLDTLSDEFCQVNTHVGSIVWWQAVMGGFTMASSPSLETSENKSDDGTDSDDTNEGDDAGLPNDDVYLMYLPFCHSWQKGRVVLRWE